MIDIKPRGARLCPNTAFVCHSDPEVIEVITLYLNVVGWDISIFDEVPEHTAIAPRLLFISDRHSIPRSFLRDCLGTKICILDGSGNDVAHRQSEAFTSQILALPISIQDLEQMVVDAS